MYMCLWSLAVTQGCRSCFPYSGGYPTAVPGSLGHMKISEILWANVYDKEHHYMFWSCKNGEANRLGDHNGIKTWYCVSFPFDCNAGMLSLTVYIHWIAISMDHDDVIRWKHFSRYWSFVWGIQRSSVNSPYKDQWRTALMFSLIHAWTSGWVNNRDDDDLGRHRTHYDVTLILYVDIIKRSRFGCASFWSIYGYSISLWIELSIFTHIPHCHFADTRTIIKLLLYSWIKPDKYR